MSEEIKKDKKKINISRIGKSPITIPSGVKLNYAGRLVTVEGPKGKLTQELPEGIELTITDNIVELICNTTVLKIRAQHGLMRTLVNNMVDGVSKGFEKILEIVGVGYRVSMKGKDLDLAMGFSHPYLFEAPAGIEFSVEGTQKITVKGIDKQQVGQVAADIRMVRKPEPYKGKGIRYQGEKILLKAGKSGKK